MHAKDILTLQWCIFTSTNSLLRWLDDTHAFAVFGNPQTGIIAVHTAISFNPSIPTQPETPLKQYNTSRSNFAHTLSQTCILSVSAVESFYYGRVYFTPTNTFHSVSRKQALPAPKPRPPTSIKVAQRLLAGALGVRYDMMACTYSNQPQSSDISLTSALCALI